MMHTNFSQNRILRRLLWGATFAGCVLAAAGCETSELHGEDFDSASTPRANGSYLQSMSAASAAQQGALQEQDFGSNTLNSLGQVQLDLLVKGTPPTQPLVVHMDFPQTVEADALATREASATTYLLDRGVPKSEIQFVEGPNTGKSLPTAAVLPLAYHVDGTSFTGAPADDAAASVTAK